MAYFYYNIHYYNIHLYCIKSTLTLARLGRLWLSEQIASARLEILFYRRLMWPRFLKIL
jgi:hypothetical protein